MTKGISILLPIYNWDCRPLVFVLHQQGLECGLPFEIVCMDDASDRFRSVNEELAHFPNVRFFSLKENVGRSKIRNLLAERTKYEYLLFLDCDSGVGDGFLKKYVKSINGRNDSDVIIGGRIYQKERPQEQQVLHWQYGRKREQRSNRQRGGFQSNNFMIKKSLFEKIGFEESINSYGHEDTLFGVALKRHHAKIRKINAPVVHLELKDSDRFLKDTKSEILNIYKFWQQPSVRPSIKNISLIKLFNRIIKYKLSMPIAIRYVKNHEKIECRLRENPTLFYLDRYRLGYMCYIHHKKGEKRTL